MPGLLKPGKRVSEGVQGFLDSLAVSGSTKRAYSGVLRQLESGCADKELSWWTVERLDRYRQLRQKTQSPRTLNKELAIWRLFFGWCEARAWLTGNPAKRLRPFRCGVSPKEPFSQDELARLLFCSEAAGPKAHALVLLMRHTGLRLSDACRVADRDITDGYLTVRTHKTGKDMLLPIPHSLIPNPQSPFPITWPLPMGYWPARRLLEGVFKTAGMPNCTPHRFRHTLAAELLARGASMPDVALILGITTNVCERHYAKFSPARQERISRLLTPAIGGQLESQTQ